MNQLKKFREKARLSQEALAEKSGFGKKQSRISNYELGLRTPTLDESRRIVAALNEAGVECTLDDVFPVDTEQGAAAESAA